MEFLSSLEDVQELTVGLVLARPDRKFLPSYFDALHEGMKPARHKTPEEEVENLTINPEEFRFFSETCTNAMGTENYCLEDLFWLTQQDQFIGYASLCHDLAPQRQKYGGNTGCEIRPSQRNKGYGTTALKMRKLLAQNRGYAHLEMVTAADNIAAIRPWQKCGGIIVEEYSDPPKEFYGYTGAAVKYKISLEDYRND